MLKAEINQTYLRGGARLPLALTHRVLREVSRALNLKKQTLISVAFISPSHMRRLNREWRRHDKVTDVLSFPLPSSDPKGAIGEVLLCYEQAAKQAKEAGHSTRHEVVMLLAHGILHVFGFDHETARDAAKMLPLQARILKTVERYV